MEPTLQNGQVVIFRKFFLVTPNPRRGDIVLYYPQEGVMEFVGRVVALPSESIGIENGNLYLDDNNGQYRVEEEYLPYDTKTTAYQEGRWFKLGRFEYFIVGDKRDDQPINIQSSFIHRDNIKAKLFLSFKK